MGRRTDETPDPLDPPHQALPAYRPFPVRLRPRCEPDDRCPEPGCTKTVAEHIAEFKRYGTAITARLVTL